MPTYGLEIFPEVAIHHPSEAGLEPFLELRAPDSPHEGNVYSQQWVESLQKARVFKV